MTAGGCPWSPTGLRWSCSGVGVALQARNWQSELLEGRCSREAQPHAARRNKIARHEQEDKLVKDQGQEVGEGGERGRVCVCRGPLLGGGEAGGEKVGMGEPGTALEVRRSDT